MRIQELERQVGIDRATIRFYEKEGLITPERSDNGYRDYSPDDADELRRIKLLRALGVSLDTIRGLQAGQEDFAAVMRRQAHILEGRRDQMERARIVCERIGGDGVTYTGMDTGLYQGLLNAPLLPGPAEQGSGAVFQEQEYREPHPWRRFFARMLDYQIVDVLLWVFIVFVLRFRTTGSLAGVLINFAAWFLMVPIEAAWLHFVGTTPGKWIFGIRVEASEGVRLRWPDALSRAWKVLHAGMGFNIIGLNLYCFWEGYRAHKDRWYTEWDADCEIVFRDGYSVVNVLMAVLVLLAAGGVDFVTERQMQLPGYQSNQLTVAQFAANYNYFDQLIWSGTMDPMDRDGSIRFPEYHEYMVLPEEGELESDPYVQFEYELEGDAIKAITVHHTWYAQNWLGSYIPEESDKPIDKFGWWAPHHCQAAILVAIASQEGVNITELSQYHQAFSDDCVKPCGDGLTAEYGAVTCTWDLDLEIYRDYPADSAAADVYEATLDLRIQFGA